MSQFRCYSCKRPSDTEAEHIGHRCRWWSRPVVAFWRKWIWRLFRYHPAMKILEDVGRRP